MALRQQRMQGMDYDIELTEPRDDQVSAIRKMENVKYAGLSVKCAVSVSYTHLDVYKRQLLHCEICPPSGFVAGSAGSQGCRYIYQRAQEVHETGSVNY